MIAVDTNVIVRLLTGDEPRQSEQARLLFDRETIFLPKTVLLEAEWVLRRLYRLERAARHQRIDRIGGAAERPMRG